MASEEHLDLLRRGVTEWNLWRAGQPDIRPDLSGANLSGAALSGVNLSKATLIGATLSETDLRRANLRAADLSGVDLFKADLFGADLGRADLRGADLIRANLIEVNLGGANLSEADLSWADLIRVDLSQANLSRAALIRTNLVEADLSQSNLFRVTLRAASLSRADLSETNLSEADLSGANLSRANLFGADLDRANLNGANLGAANLSGANLSGANLGRAELIGTDLSRANLSRANLDRADLSEARLGLTIFGDVDLREVRGLETIKHFSRSYIDIHTLYRSQGRIPPLFLKGVGAPDTFITYIGSLNGQTIAYHPCFISYSSQDDAFAERLYFDLQQAGVPCWFAPEDLKIRAKIRLSIDETIRRHDKLVLVLSEHSVKSRWVEHEIETALAREHRHSETVLFAIRLDDAVLNLEGGWAMLLRNTRQISDFSAWKDYDAYDIAFREFLRDLKVES